MVTLEDPLIQSTKAQLKKLNTSMPTSTSSSTSKLLFNPTNPLKRQRFQLRSNHITRILKKKNRIETKNTLPLTQMTILLLTTTKTIIEVKGAKFLPDYYS